MKDLLQKIINRAKLFGLSANDISNAGEFLDNNEFGECLNLVATQLYEHNIKIDVALYNLIIEASIEMDIPMSGVDYVKDIVIR